MSKTTSYREPGRGFVEAVPPSPLADVIAELAFPTLSAKVVGEEPATIYKSLRADVTCDK